MNISYKTDQVIVDKTGWASITRKNMNILDISYSDLYYLALDMDECNGLFRSLFFIKVRGGFDEFSKVVEFKKKQLRGGFQINPVLRLLKVNPPFICEIVMGDCFDFGIRLPDYKRFSIKSEVQSHLKPMSQIVIHLQ